MNTGQACTWESAVLRLRDDPQQQGLVEACFYDDPLLGAARRYHASTEWHAVRQLIESTGVRALDVGAGRGIASFALAADGWEVTALEPDGSNVVGAGAIAALAADAGLPITVVQEWGEKLPFPNASFELVHCRQVLHHARDLGRLCSELARVLVPGGRLIATREHVITRQDDLPRFLSAHPLHHLYGGECAYTLKQYREAMLSAGLALQATFNPWESDINLYPDTLNELKRRWARKSRILHPNMIPNSFVTWLGSITNTPGRLYTFLAVKPERA